MWEGDIEFTEEMGSFRPGERVGVRMMTQQYNIRNMETLDWTRGMSSCVLLVKSHVLNTCFYVEIKLAKLKRHPRGILKRKHALRYFIQVWEDFHWNENQETKADLSLQDSHILRVDPTSSKSVQSLLNILDRKHWGLLEPVIDNSEAFTPLLIFLSQVGNECCLWN